jgi:hypothetical protein
MMVSWNARDLYECDECTLVYARKREYQEVDEGYVETSIEPEECDVCKCENFTQIVDHAAAEASEAHSDLIDDINARLA